MSKAIVVGTQVYEIPANPLRTCLVVANEDAVNKIYWGQTGEVTVASGIPVKADSIQVFTVEQGDNPHKAKYLIAAQEVEVRINEEARAAMGPERWRKKFGTEEEIRKSCEVDDVEDGEYA